MGKVSGAVHRNENPKAAPACAYVPMAQGSSFAAPAIKLGINAFRIGRSGWGGTLASPSDNSELRRGGVAVCTNFSDAEAKLYGQNDSGGRMRAMVPGLYAAVFVYSLDGITSFGNRHDKVLANLSKREQQRFI